VIAIPAFGAEPSDGAYTLALRKAMRDGGDLMLHVRAAGGRIVQSWATAPSIGNIGYDANTSGVRIDAAGRMAGTMWAVVNYSPFELAVDVGPEAGAKPGPDGSVAMAGTYRAVCGRVADPNVMGALNGRVAARATPKRAVRLELLLDGALEAASPAIGRMLVTFALDGGKASDANVSATTDRKPTPHWTGKVDRIDLAYDGKQLRGTLTCTTDRSGFLTSPDRTHTWTIDASVACNRVRGTHTIRRTATHTEGGAVTGTAVPVGAGDANALAAVVTLPGAMGGQDLELYLEGEGGRVTGAYAVCPKRPLTAHPVAAEKLELEGGRVAGELSVTVEALGWAGKGPAPEQLRCVVDGSVTDANVVGGFSGSFAARAAAGAVSGRREPWQAVERREALAAGSHWPCWRGTGGGTGVDSGAALVEDLHRARLVWKSQESTPDAWLWSNSSKAELSGGYASPVVAGGRVYMAYFVPSGGEFMEQIPTKRGSMEVKAQRKYLIDADDVLLCVDAATGRTLWRTSFQGTGINYNHGLAGPLMTPAVAGGRAYFIGSGGGVFGVDAASGKEAWRSDVGDSAATFRKRKEEGKRQRTMPRANQDFCAAPLVVAGVVVCNDNAGGLIGLSEADGRRAWGPVGEGAAKTCSPVRWTHGGREYAIAAGVKHGFCVDVRTGKLAWEIDEAGDLGTPAVAEDHAVFSGGGLQAKSGLSCWHLSAGKAQLAWRLEGNYNNHVTSPVVYRGRVYAFRGNATVCLDLETGKELAAVPFPGVRTCSSLIAFDGRVVREDLWERVYFYNADPAAFRQLGPRWEIGSHAQCTTAAAADGRLFIRGRDCVWCYDLRVPASGGPGNAELDEARSWLGANPPDGNNATERRRRMAAIQSAADALEPATFQKYLKAIDGDAAAADAMDAAGVLHYLRKSTEAAIADIRRTRVRKGVAMWHVYNMGYVFRTPDACFGIDLHGRGVEALAKDLDFALNTHGHGDHVSRPLMAAMLTAGKPVVTSWLKGSRLVPIAAPPAEGEKKAVPATMPSTEMKFGTVRVKVDIGDHHKYKPETRNDMLMFQVDCGPAAGDCTIYHSGDCDNPAKMRPDGAVTVFIPHVQPGMAVEDAIRQVRPRMTLVSHVLELMHSPKPPQPWRFSFDYAFGTIKNTPEDKATVLTWGERWLAPGCELAGGR
jgi:outer membrane protein assembly factor BamB